MLKKLIVALLACVVVSPQAAVRAAQGSAPASAPAFTEEQLDNLLASIALYPDPLIAQVLPAATFVDQVEAAARVVRGISDTSKIDKKIENQSWDVAVKAVAHYPQVLYMMADTLDWTTALGQAYVTQSTDVLASIQRLRARAKAAGTLVTTAEQKVVVEDSSIKIVPAQPQVIYVPQYNPQVVYVEDDDDVSTAVLTGVIAFGTGLAIGAWLNNDCDWHTGHVYYHGWSGVGWVSTSRSYVNVNSVYVNRSFTNVNVNRTVVNRNVNYNNISTYNNVNRNVNYNNVNRNNVNVNNNNVNVNRNNVNVNQTNNHVINQNVNAANPRVDANRKPQNRPATQPATRPATQPAARPAQQPTARPSAQSTSRQAQPRGFGDAKGRQDTMADSNRGRASRDSASKQPAGGGGRQKPASGGGRGRRN